MDNPATPLPRLTLRKSERLRHRSLVNALFERGQALYSYPLRMQWMATDSATLDAGFRASRPLRLGPLQMMITIPKRKHRHAVDRVLLRRRVREAYRLNRLSLRELAYATADGGTISLSFIYISDKICDYAQIEKSMRRLLGQVADACHAGALPSPPSPLTD